MERFFPAAAAIIFAIVLVYDILGHRNMKVRRCLPDWIFLCLLGVGLIGMLTVGIRNLIGAGGDRAGLYLAYRYLMDDDSYGARRSVKNDSDLTEEQKSIIELLSTAIEGDYPSLYFDARKLLDGTIQNADQQSAVEELQSFAAAYLRQDSAVTQLTSLGTSDSGSESGAEESSPFAGLIETCFEAENFQNTEELDAYYNLDRLVRSGQPDAADSTEVDRLAERYGRSPEILKLAAGYYVQTGDYGKAEDLAQSLVELDGSAENLVIYTDIIAQEAYSVSYQDSGQNSSDPEKQALLEEARKLEERARNYDEGEERREEILNEAAELYQQAADVDIRRAVNFLEAKRPLFDNTGMYDLQLAKMYMLLDEREEAQSRIRSLMDDAAALSDSSPIKAPLMDVQNAYNQSSSDETSPQLRSSVSSLIAAETQGIVPQEEGTINEKMTDYVVSALKYDKLGIFVSRIDTSAYPEITAYLNINGQKEGRWGMVSEFYADDFEIIDTQYQVTDFRLNSDASRLGVDIAIVLDTSGSMEGTPLEDAKLAAQACVENMDTDSQDISIISYESSASTVVERTDSQDRLNYGISQLSAGGGTDISAGLSEGLNSLEGSGAGTQAIILMTDGQDGNSQEAMDEVLSRANSANVAVYTVGLGDVQEEYLKNIAERTGGKYLLADNTTELEDIYLTLQQYIVNNYVLTYTVTENVEEDPRYLLVSLPAYQVSGQREYTISGGAGEAVEIGGDRIKPTTENDSLITAVAPGSLSVSDVEKGADVTITGSGFTDGMHFGIGTLELQDVRVTDENTATGVLKGSLAAGSYAVRASYPDGRIAVKNEAFYVFRAGVTTGVRIGSTIIKADSIGQISDTGFVASGNVLINDFLHYSGTLEITAAELPEELTLQAGQTAYLGNSGTVEGNGLLYISYAQADGEKKNFANLVMGGKNYEVINGEFEFDISGSDTSMDQSWELTIPGITNVTVGEISLETDGLKVHIDELNPKKIYESIKDGLTGEQYSVLTKEAADTAGSGKSEEGSEEKPQSKDKAFRFRLTDTSASLDLALRQNNIEFGGEVKLDMNDAFQFGCFGLRELQLKFNTLDDSQEYWYLGGAIDFSTMIPGFGGSGVSGMEAHIASWYWMFDEMEVGVDLYPGIGIYNFLYVDKMSLSVDGVSALFLDSGWIPDAAKEVMFAGMDMDVLQQEKPDFKLVGNVEADVNLFKSLHLSVPEDMTKWGELGSINGDITLNFSEKSFDITAALKLLGHEIANASLGIGPEGLYAEAGAQLELEMLGCQLGGGIDLGFRTTMQQLKVNFGIDGHADCNMLNVHWTGDIGLELLAKYDGTLFSVTLTHGDDSSRFWYEDNGELFLIQKLHFA